MADTATPTNNATTEIPPQTPDQETGLGALLRKGTQAVMGLKAPTAPAPIQSSPAAPAGPAPSLGAALNAPAPAVQATEDDVIKQAATSPAASSKPDQFPGITSEIRAVKNRAADISTEGAGLQAGQAAMASMSQAKEDPYFKGQLKTLEDRLNKIDSQKDAIRSMHADQQDKISWLQALETIGQSITQYAAARYGRDHGVNLAGLNMQKTDWQAMMDRSQKQMQFELGNLEAQERDALGEKKEVLRDISDFGKEGAKAQIMAEREKQSALKEADVLGLRGEEIKANIAGKEDVADIRAAGRGAPGSNKQDALLKEQGVDLEKKRTALQDASNRLSSLDSLSSKEQQKQLPIIEQQLAKAGLDIGQVYKPGEGLFGSAEYHPEILKKNLDEITSKLGSINTQRTQRAGSPSVQATPGVQAAPAAPSAGKDPQILDYASKHGLDYDKAKDLLVRRGYTPVEK